MTDKCQLILHDEVKCSVRGLHLMHHQYLYDQLAIPVEGAFFTPQYKLGSWDGKNRYYEMDGRTYVKILNEIVPFVVGWGYDVEVIDHRKSHPSPPEIDKHFFGDIIGYGGKPFELRDYQVKFVNALIKEGCGIGIAATGAGKTSMTGALCESYGKMGYNTLTIVPSGDLVTQTYDAYAMFNMDVGMYSGDVKDVNHTHVVATWQSLQNNPQLMQMFQMVVVDETHGAKAKVIRELINDHGGHISFRFGVTGTLPKDKNDQYALKISIGRHIEEISVTAKWLMDNGFLAKVDIEMYNTLDPKLQLPDYSSEKGWLSRNEERLEYLAQFCIEAKEKHGNTLVLVNSVTFGRKLKKLIPDAVFMSGDTAKADRKEQYDMYDTTDDKILICTTGIASTGISIDRIFCMVMIDSGKSFIRAIQSVGRGLRLAEDKNEVVVKDISSNMKYSSKHRRARIKFYKEAEYPCSKVKGVKY